MTKINLYGPEGQIVESVDLSKQPVYNDPACQHIDKVVVEDNSGIEDVVAYQCRSCSVGWLVREKIKGEKK